ncbi:MAG: DUF3050 domain-containing protein [Burkholderiales bacterium]|nr:DUF3050 domain-containing protein [Bacteroidia bacterium]
MNLHLKKFQEEIEPISQEIINHKVYSTIKTVKDITVFMEHHIFVVWEFMSLLKSFQKNLIGVNVSLVPVGSSLSMFLTNDELREESDVDEERKSTSHFELYLTAMEQAGCNMEPIHTFIKSLNKKIPVTESGLIAGIPMESAEYIENTFSLNNADVLHIQAAVFTFGRANQISGMFISFVNELNKQTNNKISILKDYLERHIEVDGDHHSHPAYQLIEKLCGDDPLKWEKVTVAVKDTLRQRIILWNAITAKVIVRHK